jgi:hypothetical protein
MLFPAPASQPCIFFALCQKRMLTAHGPPKAGNVDHDNSAGGSMLLAGCELFTFTELWYCGQECSDVHHADRLEGDADTERAFPADYVDKEEGA